MTTSSNDKAHHPDGGRPDDGGIGKPDCPHCEGLGYVVAAVGPDDPGFGRAVPCVCRAAEAEKARLDSLMRLSQIGALTHCTFENFIPEGHGLTASRQRNLRMAYERAAAFAAAPVGWLVLKGGYGCGKTHLAAAIANRQLAAGRAALFINTPDLLDHLRATFSPQSTVSYDERFDQVRNSSLLLLDDLGTQSNSEWAQEKLYQILNYRYNAKLPTVITTNLDLESIEIRIRSRMVDPDLSQIIHIAAPDFRRAGVGDDQSDLSTLNLHGDKTFESFDLRESELPRPQADNLHRALQLAVAFADRPADWLVFNSVAYGNGKTAASWIIISAWARRAWARRAWARRAWGRKVWPGSTWPRPHGRCLNPLARFPKRCRMSGAGFPRNGSPRRAMNRWKGRRSCGTRARTWNRPISAASYGSR